MLGKSALKRAFECEFWDNMGLYGGQWDQPTRHGSGPLARRGRRDNKSAKQFLKKPQTGATQPAALQQSRDSKCLRRERLPSRGATLAAVWRAADRCADAGNPRAPWHPEGCGGASSHERGSRSQPACKPGSVRRPKPCGDHSSGTPLARRLVQPTRTTGPERGRRLPPPSSLFGLAPGGGLPCRDRCRRAVGSYPPLSPLPRDPKAARRSALCGTVPGVTPAGRLPGTVLLGARTFLPAVFRRLRQRSPAGWLRAVVARRPGAVKRRRPIAGRIRARREPS